MQIHNQTIYGGNQQFADTMTNNFNSLQQSNASDEVKELFTKLLNEINALKGNVPAGEIENVTANTADLLEEVNSPTPRKEVILAILKRMKDSAKQWGEKASPYLAIIEVFSLLPF